MILRETCLENAYVIEMERKEDERGFFARSWCQQEFRRHGLNASLVQCNVSFNKKKGTLRGMHYQVAPAAEAKLVRCTMGAIWDVIIDLRRESKTYKQYFNVELTATNRRMVYIPEGFAHGFLTLTDDTEVFYQMSTAYSPDHARGIRWNDPAFGIPWPEQHPIMSEKDRRYDDFNDSISAL